MDTAITVLHVIVAFFLIVIVLLQTGKGASMGAIFGGGSSHTLFGSRGAGNFLTKLTTAAAVIFMLTSLSISVMSSNKTMSTISLPETGQEETDVEKKTPEEPISEPSTPAEKANTPTEKEITTTAPSDASATDTPLEKSEKETADKEQ